MKRKKVFNLLLVLLCFVVCIISAMQLFGYGSFCNGAIQNAIQTALLLYLLVNNK